MRLKEREGSDSVQHERKAERGAGVDGRLQGSRAEWLGALNHEPGFIDVELGALIEESSPWNLGTHGVVTDENIRISLIE